MRHEFFEGEIFAMAGGTGRHNDLVQNFVLALRPKLRGSACRLKVETMRLAVRRNRHYVYPDVMVSCHPDDQRAEQQYQHPVLILEVLSPSTEAYDRGSKFRSYQQLPSLRHYLLVSQEIWLVEWFRKNEHGGWDYTALAEADDRLPLPEFGAAQKGFRLNCWGLLSRDNRCHWATTSQNITAAFVRDRLEELSRQLTAPTVIVLDNARIHTATLIQQCRQRWAQRDLHLLFLPPCSPHLHIAETVWRHLKGGWLQPADYAQADNLAYATNRCLADFGKALTIKFSPFKLN